MQHYRVNDGVSLTCPATDGEYRRIVKATQKGEEIEDRKEITVGGGELCDAMPPLAIAAYLQSGHIFEVDELGRPIVADAEAAEAPETAPPARRRRGGES